MSRASLLLEAFVLDLLADYEALGTLDLQPMKSCWKQRRFGSLHHVVQTCSKPNLHQAQKVEMTRVLLRRLFEASERVLVRPGPLARRMGAFYIMFIAYATQSLQPKEKLAISGHALHTLLQLCKRGNRAVDPSNHKKRCDGQILVEHLAQSNSLRIFVSPESIQRANNLIANQKAALFETAEDLLLEVRALKQEVESSFNSPFHEVLEDEAQGGTVLSDAERRAKDATERAQRFLDGMESDPASFAALNTEFNLPEAPAGQRKCFQPVPRNPLTAYQRWKLSRPDITAYKMLPRPLTLVTGANENPTSTLPFALSDSSSDDSSSDSDSDHGFELFQKSLEASLAHTDEPPVQRDSQKSSSSLPVATATQGRTVQRDSQKNPKAKKRRHKDDFDLDDPSNLLYSLKSALQSVKQASKNQAKKRQHKVTSNAKAQAEEDKKVLDGLTHVLKGVKRQKNLSGSQKRKRKRTSSSRDDLQQKDDLEILSSLESFLKHSHA